MARTLDKDLKKLGRLETATADLARSLALPGAALIFLLAVALFALRIAGVGDLAIYVVFGTVVAGYMALNIGANDVANNMAPAVGSRALSLTAALIIAAVCETAGALLAGGAVVDTISRGIIEPVPDLDAQSLILLMTSALLAGALWLNLATLLGAPVSTTHSIVGAVLGAGIVAFGVSAVSWTVMGGIAASWVISPIMGGVIAAALLAFIKWRILFREDRVAAARRWVPALVALMAGVFTLYMFSKGLSRIWSPSLPVVLIGGVVMATLGWLIARPWVLRKSRDMENARKQVATLFVPPLIMAAALLSFAHGANDVANAVGPLAAIVAAAQTGSAQTGAVILPIWVLLVGGLGISLGLALFGPRLIRTVGEKITRMDPMRAFCVALAAGCTVLVASVLGLPVSSTHIAIGGVFGVGLLREVMTNRGMRRRSGTPGPAVLAATPEEAVKADSKRQRRMLVRRQHVWGIAAAWVVTVPAVAALSGVIYLVLTRFLG
ncbi:MAG: inorganic phosphate transporter [Brevundimonas sp.]|uniref:inorganic phosphate transporter n=1 Tax=Brevundimonas sp. TaxID=1871086 RepID=UPI00391BD651